MKNRKRKRRFHLDGIEYVYITDGGDRVNVYKDKRPFCTILFNPFGPGEAKEAINSKVIA